MIFFEAIVDDGRRTSSDYDSSHSTFGSGELNMKIQRQESTINDKTQLESDQLMVGIPHNMIMIIFTLIFVFKVISTI